MQSLTPQTYSRHEHYQATTLRSLRAFNTSQYAPPNSVPTDRPNIKFIKLHKLQRVGLFSMNQITQDKLLWAFAIDTTKPLVTTKHRTRRATQPKYKLHRYNVTSCSPRLRQFGVKVGMSYDQAKAIAPDMRIFVYNR